MEKTDGFKLRDKPPQNTIQSNAININNIKQKITNELNIIADNQQELNNL